MIEGITYILNENYAFQQEVGQNVAGTKYKIYPVMVPQQENVPYAVARLTAKRLQHKGRSGLNRSQFECEFTVSCYANNYDDLEDMEDTVIQALVPYRGTANGVVFGYIEYMNSSDDFVEVAGGLYVRITSFVCSVTKTALT